MTDLAMLADVVAGHRIRYTGEPELRNAIAELLTKAGVRFEREFLLDMDVGRLDFFVVNSGMAIEVKTRGGRSELARQVMRYAEHPRVRGILVVTTRLQHYLPPMMAGKPVRVMALPRWLA